MSKTILHGAAMALLIAAGPAANAVPVLFTAAGPNAAAIAATVDAFRLTLGALNANVAGSFDSGRRELSWDGVSDANAAPNLLPLDFFNVNSPRGVVFATPGSGVAVSADAVNPTSTPVEFGDINPVYPLIFATFSAERLFTAIGSNVVDAMFFVPGSATPALSSGFGAVFTDVDQANVTSIQFFDATNSSLGQYFAPAVSGDQTLSFLGVHFTEGAVVSRVRITAGTQPLGVVSTGDVVAMDDFIYGEPIAARAVPEPAPLPLALLAGGLAAAAARRHRIARRVCMPVATT